MSFINLHAHSEASISDGLFHPKKWVEALKQKGFKAHALTDHGSMASLIPFYKLMRAEKMTPLMGCEFYYVDEPTIKTAENRKASHLILIAKNYDGFRNMLKLSKLSYTDGYYYKPRIGLDWLTKYSEGLVCLTACQGGVLAQEVWRDSRGEVSDLTGRFKQFQAIFGKDFYVEFQAHNTVNTDKETGETFNSQELINAKLYELRNQKGFQAVATNDCHYILQEHAEIQRVIKQISWGKAEVGESATVNDDHFTDSLWLKTGKQVYNTFKEHHEYLPSGFIKEAILRTEEILDKCAGFEMPKDKRYLPKFRPTVDSKRMFKVLTVGKLKAFLKKPLLLRGDESVYIERFKREFKVIAKYNLEDYFLIVWDLIEFAKKRGIYTGLGRGSAAGCFISYLLDIVKVDPIEYKLLFERFLNENRCETGEMPDIDLDFESEHRDEIKKYIYDTYGTENVCEIGTYGRMKLKTALIDFSKALGAATHAEILSMTTKLDLDKEEVDNVQAAMEFDPKIATLMRNNPKLEFMLTEIVGQIKTQAVHPAGLVICPEPVSDVTPVKSQKNNKVKNGERVIATQTEDKHVIAQGLMKVDILGLKEYDVIHYVVDNAPGFPFKLENYVEEIMRAEYLKSDKKVWGLFQEGRTEAVFQFASDGMKGLLKEMVPTEVNDLIAANALYRPGCLENGWHLDYCRRKSGEEEVTYVHEDVEAALGETFGVIVYQEQFMSVMHTLGGISLVDADTIRSALGKKDKDKLNKFQAAFVSAAGKKIGTAEAKDLWDQIEKASGYTFNKSHSAAYSVLAYISQYLKAHYTSHFWAAQLHWNVNKNKLEDLLTDRRAASDMGVKYVLPDVNRSKKEFYVTPEREIIWSIRAIGSVGPKAADEILARQPFHSFEDFYKRVNKSVVKFNIIESLIYGGAFDTINDRRESLRLLYELANGKKKGEKARKYISPSEEKIMMKFRESIGFFERKVKDLKGNFEDCSTEADLRLMANNESLKVGGVITEVRVIKTKKGDPMAFVTVMDLDEIIDVTVFPNDFLKHRELLKKETIVEITGQKNTFGDKQNAMVLKWIVEK
jgi:DNA polymerase-3 subunit alpha